MVGWEDIEVPAGKFRALKVQAEGTFRRSIGPSPDEARNTYWYVPQVKRWVKTSTRIPQPRSRRGAVLLQGAVICGSPAAMRCPGPGVCCQGARAVVAKRFMVAAAHPLAAEAGAEVLKRGGSALDAAIAVQTMLGLVEPESSGIGGGAFLLYWSAARRSCAPTTAARPRRPPRSPDRFLDDGKPLEFMDAAVGGRSVGVPGVLRMLELAHRASRTPALGELFDAAIRTADEASCLRRSCAQRSSARTICATIRRRGGSTTPGARIVNREYADTLRPRARRRGCSTRRYCARHRASRCAPMRSRAT